MTQELISRLEVRDLNPNIVIAANARRLDSQSIKLNPQIYKDRIILPLTLYNKLTPDEWKPLIASKLIYHRNLNKKRKLLDFSYSVFPYLMIIPFVIASSILGIIPHDPTVKSLAFVLWLFAMFPVAKLVYAPFFGRLEQTADKQTMELFVNPTLESVLSKIEMMNPQESKANKAIKKRVRLLQELVRDP